MIVSTSIIFIGSAWRGYVGTNFFIVLIATIISTIILYQNPQPDVVIAATIAGWMFGVFIRMIRCKQV